jgi:hypothetical protein
MGGGGGGGRLLTAVRLLRGEIADEGEEQLLALAARRHGLRRGGCSRDAPPDSWRERRERGGLGAFLEWRPK